MPKLKNMAWKMNARGAADWEDLVQAAAQALMRARELFDPSRASWRTYALRRAGGAMLDALRDIDHVPRMERLKAKKDGRFVRRVLSVDADPVRAVLQGYGRSQVQNAFQEAADADVWISHKRLLGPRLASIVDLYFREDRTLKEIARQIGLSESRACQLLARALRLLRRHAKKQEASC